VAERVSARLSAPDGRRFGFAIGTAFLVLAGLAWWREHTGRAGVLAVVSGLLLAVAWLAPTRLDPVRRAWMSFSVAISKVTTPVLLGVVYFVVLAPVGMLMSLAHRNLLKRPRGASSFWVKRAPGTESRVDMQHQF
jgi:saxitoxin biosynthesis operon SxtJ-like protein